MTLQCKDLGVLPGAHSFPDLSSKAGRVSCTPETTCGSPLGLCHPTAPAFLPPAQCFLLSSLVVTSLSGHSRRAGPFTGSYRFITQIQRGPSLKEDKHKQLHGELGGTGSLLSSRAWLATECAREHAECCKMKTRGPLCNIAESSGIVSAERQTSKDPSAGPARLLREHGLEASPARDRY